MRLMFAVRPPPAVESVLAGVARPGVERVEWTVPARWIVKLRPLGHVRDELRPPLLEAVRAELDGAGPVPVRLGRATRRYANQLLCLPVPELIPLAEAIFEVTGPIVPVTHPQPIHTDLVLASGRIPANLVELDVVASWMVTRVVLIADRSSPRGVRLEDVGRVELTG
jgi:2'-5' RNA ligase